MSRVLALALVALLAATAGATLAPGDHRRVLPFGGLPRIYVLHVPPGWDGATPAPLVVDLHGFTSDADEQRAVSGMGAVSNANGFLVVYPNGWRNAWNGSLCCGNAGIDDVGFIRAVVDAVAAEAAVDRRRVYATGLSNGGAMSHRLACDAADLFAAAAPMAFPLSYRPAPRCQPSRAIPVLTVMGLTDNLVEYDDGFFGSAAATFAYWREVNGCGGGAPDVLDERGRGRCEYDTTCEQGVQVGLCSVTARAFPGTAIDGHVLYLNPDFVLAETAWAFLSQFALPEHAAAAPEAELAGPDRVKLGRGVPLGPRLAPLTWTVRLGKGTWGAVSGDTVLSGSWRRARRRGRTGSAMLTSEGRRQLEELMATRIAARIGGTADATLEADRPIRLRFNRAGAPTRLRGRWRILRGGVPGAVIGRYELRLRRAR